MFTKDMNLIKEYEDFIAITSQFYFCPYPLRLDTYNKCSFGCKYCFSGSRKGNFFQNELKMGRVSRLEKYFERSNEQKPKRIISQLIKHKVPIHMGGMTDPFSDYEIKYRSSFNIISFLAERCYPTIISSKSNMMTDFEYITLLSKKNFIIQVSLLAINSKKSEKLEPGSNLLENRIDLIKKLIEHDCKIVLRIQPVLPTFENEIIENIEYLINLGIQNFTVEYLKLSIEKNNDFRQIFNQISNCDIQRLYKDGTISGREYIYPFEKRTSFYRKLQKIKNRYNNITFSFADNDLLHLNKYNCCTGAYNNEELFSDIFSYNYSTIIKDHITEKRTGEIDFIKKIKQCPFDGSISHYVNSKSRIRDSSHNFKNYLNHHLLKNSNLSPQTFFGIKFNEGFIVDYDKLKKFWNILGAQNEEIV